MIFNVVASNLANPDALAPIKGEFSSGVISRFPMVLRKLSFMYSLMAGLGCLMMREPAKITATWFPLYDPDGDKPSKEELKEKLVACLTSRRFITLCIMAWLAAAGGYTVANEYRTFGQAASVLRTDAHGRDLGVLCAVANGLGRPVWGVLVDNFGIAKPWLLLAIMQTGVSKITQRRRHFKTTMAAAQRWRPPAQKHAGRTMIAPLKPPGAGNLLCGCDLALAAPLLYCDHCPILLFGRRLGHLLNSLLPHLWRRGEPRLQLCISGLFVWERDRASPHEPGRF
mmetsp:Transcript_55588/g.153403  ORF Transcript_55588/g.153403 Transcript_55588/m.153403 type:complete len:284 (-) Transcript_55588:879-1730(-)